MVGSRFVQVDDDLQREDEVSVEVAVQCVPVPLAVAQQDCCRLVLPGVVAHAQPFIQRVRPRGGAAEFRVPVAGDRHQPGVQCLLEPFHRLRVRELEVAVLPLPETVPAHVDRCAEVLVVLVQGADACRLGVREQLRQQGAAVLVHFGCDGVPVAGVHPPPPRVCAVPALRGRTWVLMLPPGSGAWSWRRGRRRSVRVFRRCGVPDGRARRQAAGWWRRRCRPP